MKAMQIIISAIVGFSQYNEFNRPKRGRCLFKKHTHTIDIHVKKEKERETNNTQKNKERSMRTLEREREFDNTNEEKKVTRSIELRQLI